MGLFKKKASPEPREPEIKEVYKDIYVNLTDKMMRVELVDDHAYIQYGEISQDGSTIQLSSRGILIAMITKKSKVYAELEPYIGNRVEYIAIDEKNGDYGVYYRVKLHIYDHTDVNY